MNEISLTKDADTLICVIYKEYLHRRKSGISKDEARCFGGFERIQAELMPEWFAEDVAETCRELSRTDLLDCLFADDNVSESALTDEGIIYMENRFKNGIASVLDYLERFRSILPL